LKGVHVASSDDTGKTDTKVPLPEVAKKLGANMIVTGLVQGSTNELRITVKLNNVAENKVVWNEEFSGLPADLLTIEDPIQMRGIAGLGRPILQQGKKSKPFERWKKQWNSILIFG